VIVVGLVRLGRLPIVIPCVVPIITAIAITIATNTVGPRRAILGHILQELKGYG